MNEVLYNIFRQSFQDSNVSYEEFLSKLDFNDSHVFKYFDRNTGKIIGYSVVRENCISLICVLPQYQKQGIGTHLLKKSEDFIKANGYNEIFLGYKGEKTSLFKGVPISNENYLFFNQNNYDNDFTVCDYEIKLDSYDQNLNNSLQIFDASSDVGLKVLFLQFLEEKDKLLYDKYAIVNNINFIFSKNSNSINGVCIYNVDKENRTLNIFDVIAYPNFDINCKKILLNEMAAIAQKNNCDKVIVRDVSNPSFYKDYSSVETKRYWRGSKSC